MYRLINSSVSFLLGSLMPRPIMKPWTNLSFLRFRDLLHSHFGLRWKLQGVLPPRVWFFCNDPFFFSQQCHQSFIFEATCDLLVIVLILAVNVYEYSTKNTAGVPNLWFGYLGVSILRFAPGQLSLIDTEYSAYCKLKLKQQNISFNYAIFHLPISNWSFDYFIFHLQAKFKYLMAQYICNLLSHDAEQKC